jgi:2-polyprenyl-3-methyl-5-hydroxy-6-metoxy-1,4-benzoquinol methylase
MIDKIGYKFDNMDKVEKRDTKGVDYTERLEKLSGVWWKEALDVQRPYRWNLRRLKPGKVLDVGCGIGRYLQNFEKGSVGVDHNKHSIEKSREKGLEAYTPEEFFAIKKFKTQKFDTMLMAHLLEHMPVSDSKKILKQYLPYIKSKVIVICPQERAYQADPTHVIFLDKDMIEQILKDAGLKIEKSFSFPLPRFMGKKIFKYNEFVVVGRK